MSAAPVSYLGRRQGKGQFRVADGKNGKHAFRIAGPLEPAVFVGNDASLAGFAAGCGDGEDSRHWEKSSGSAFPE